LRGRQRVTINAVIERLTEVVAQQGEGGAGEPLSSEGGPVTGGRVLGMTLLELNAEARRRFSVGPNVRGLVVAAIDPASDARNKLAPGDVIVEMNFDPVQTIGQARAAADRAGARAMLLYINRGGDMTFRSVRPRR